MQTQSELTPCIFSFNCDNKAMSQAEALPNDLDACHALIVEHIDVNQSLASELEKAKFEIEQLKRYIYGQRSERRVDDDSQLKLFDTETEQQPQDDLQALEEEITYRRKKRRTKSDRFPEHLPRQKQTIDVPETEQICACCGEEMPVIETDVRERLEYVPGKLLVHELHYPKRACGKCKTGVKTASPPVADQDGSSLTAGSRYGFGVTAQIILGKYADHLPLYRMEDIFARAGVVIPRSTQVGLLDAAADTIAPLVDLIKTKLIDSSILGLDDTPVRLQDPALPGKMRTARFWLCRGRDETPYNYFFFHESRGRDGPAKFLKDFHGWVTVDAYGVNDGVYLGSGGRVMASCCNVHARRKFESAIDNDPQRAAHALSLYRQLYDIEDRCKELTAADRLAVRRRESAPLMESLKTWLEAQRADPKVLPKSAIGVAVRYALNQWAALRCFLQDGALPLDNNDTERDLRRITIGRKNWMFLGSPAGGEVAARIYTLIASAARHDLDLWAYVDDVLRKLAGGEANLTKLLPDQWRAEHPESIRQYRQDERHTRAESSKLRRARRRALAKRQAAR